MVHNIEVHFFSQRLFIQKNISKLQSLKAGDILIDICVDLPHLSRYVQKYKEAINTGKFSLPSNHSEATIIRHK